MNVASPLYIYSHAQQLSWFCTCILKMQFNYLNHLYDVAEVLSAKVNIRKGSQNSAARNSIRKNSSRKNSGNLQNLSHLHPAAGAGAGAGAGVRSSPSRVAIVSVLYFEIEN
jgi:hypothetical protein